MALGVRLKLYKRLEDHRGRPLVAFVTSTRTNLTGAISSDAIGEIQQQLHLLKSGVDHLDLLLLSNGGDPATAGRIVTIIRERVAKFSVLVPQAAFSAATLVAMGANEIFMHPQGNLGPIDPQIQGGQVQFAAEDLGAFIAYAKKHVGISDQVHLTKVFEKFCEQVGPVPIGVAARSSQLSISLGQKLLSKHMQSGPDEQKAKVLAERLTREYLHHGYALGRTEAKELGLPIAERDQLTEDILWQIWKDLEQDLHLRQQFNPLSIVKKNPDTKPFFEPSQGQMLGVSVPTPYRQQYALVESVRHASTFAMDGEVVAVRKPDMSIALHMTPISAGWEDVALPGMPHVSRESPTSVTEAKLRVVTKARRTRAVQSAR